MFSDEFGEAADTRIAILRDLGIAFSEAKELGKSRLEVAKAEVKYEDYAKEYGEYLTAKMMSVPERVRKVYLDFEELVFSIAKIDGRLTTEELTRKSVYDFYRYKQLLTSHIGKQNQR